MTLEEYRYFLGMGKKQKLNNMVLQRKIRLPDTQFLQNEYLRASFFPIDPYSPFYTLFAANLVSHNTFFLHRPKTQNAHGGRNVMPRCLSEGVDIFLKSVKRQGESGHDVRVSQAMCAWLLAHMDGACRRPRHDENHCITFHQKIHTRRRDIKA